MSDIVANLGYAGQELLFLNKELYCFISGKSLCIYDLTKGLREMLWRPDTGIGCIASHLDHEYLAIAPSSGNVLELLNFSSQQVIATFEIPCASEVVNMAFSRDGGKLFVITGVSDSKLLAFDVTKVRVEIGGFYSCLRILT